MDAAHVSIGHPLRAADALRRLEEADGGAIEIRVTRAKPPGLRVTPTAEAHARLVDGARRALEAGATRVVLWHARGALLPGETLAVMGAAAPSREVAARAVDALVGALKGLATREDA